MTDDELLNTFTTLGGASRRLVEKIFRERMNRKMNGTAAEGETTAPHTEPWGPAPRPELGCTGLGASGELVGDAAARDLAASDGVRRCSGTVADHPPAGRLDRKPEAEAPGGSRVKSPGEAIGTAIRGARLK